MLELNFKNISRDKNGFHKVKYETMEKKGDAVITSSIVIILEDTEISPSEPFEAILEKCSDIAKKEYVRK